MLQSAAEGAPEKIAVVDGDQRWSYAQVHDRALCLGGFFAEQGIGAGDRIAILAVNSAAYLETYFAAAGLGAIVCPLNIRLSAPELAFILRDAGARWLVADVAFAPVLSELWSEQLPVAGILWIGESLAEAWAGPAWQYQQALVASAPMTPVRQDPATVAQLYYTSGTTGKPKGVALTHGNVGVHALCAIDELSLSEADVWAHIAPMFHLADAWACFALTAVGGQHVILPRFDAESALSTMAREGVSITNLIPTMLNLMNERLSAHPHDLSNLRLILSGGAPIAPSLVRAVMENFDCQYVQTYGMTETSPYLTLSLLHPHLQQLPAEEQFVYQAKTGRPFAAVELKVVDEAGTEIASDEHAVGEIWVRGPTVTTGYWNRPQETAAAFAGDWLKTGDLATMDPEGYVNIVDRKKDMIITGGENVYCVEVENVLYQHPDVLEAAVFGLPDPKWGEAVSAAVVLRAKSTLSAEVLVSFCKRQLAGFKSPKRVIFLASLPRTGSGKISKKKIREEIKS